MTPFGENCRGGKQTVMWAFRYMHPDSKADCFHCVEMRKLVNIQGTYKDIFSENFSPELVKTLVNIFNFREELRKLNS